LTSGVPYNNFAAMLRRMLTLLAALTVLTLAAGVSAPNVAGRDAATTSLTIYSGRDERFVKPLYDRFMETTGIELNVRYGDSATLAATLLEEGANSPADIFFAQDAGALGAVGSEGRLQVLPESILRRVPQRFRAPGKRWVGVTGRARVVAYNTDVLTARQLPATIWGYTHARWKDKVGLPPTNASFQAFVTAMRLRVGDDRTRDWLLALKENDIRFYPSNSRVLDAVASREIEVGLVNHYYLYQLKEQRPSAPVANYFLRTRRDPGALINVAGVGIVTSTKKRAAALRFINFLLSRGIQRFFAQSPGRAEYPLVRGVRPRAGLPPLQRIEGAKVNLGALGRHLPRTLELLNEVGYTR
jgi:iron(III) transport system substrate-binding protein